MIHKDRIIVFARQNRICHHELIQYHKTYVAIRYVNIGLLLKGTYRILPRSLLLVKQKEQRASYFVFTGHRSIKSLITHRVVNFFYPDPDGPDWMRWSKKMMGSSYRVERLHGPLMIIPRLQSA